MADLFPDGFSDDLAGVAGELDRIGDLADGVARTISRAFRGAILDGRSLKGVLADIGRAFADIALKAAFKPLEGLISGAVESLFTAANPTVTPFAKGGVIAAPTYFPMGLMGERGAEAIVPLQRGSDGKLGVAAGGGSVNVTFNVTTSDARSFIGAEAEVSAMLLRAVRRGSRAS